MDQKPTIGRIVHFIDRYSLKHFAAIVTEGEDDQGSITLMVFAPNQALIAKSKQGDQPGMWHWPERE